mgnify:CR=1 FL=1
MIQYDIFHISVENSVNLERCLFWALLKPAKIWSLPKNCLCSSNLKNKFQWTKKNFGPLIRKILIWTFWDYKSSWSKTLTPIQPRGVIGAPPTMYFQKMQFVGVFRPFLQRSLAYIMAIMRLFFSLVRSKKDLCHFRNAQIYLGTGGSRLMRISLLRISLLRFFKTITKIWLMRFYGLFILLVRT